MPDPSSEYTQQPIEWGKGRIDLHEQVSKYRKLDERWQDEGHEGVSQLCRVHTVQDGVHHNNTSTQKRQFTDGITTRSLVKRSHWATASSRASLAMG
jgi:hypothetical protein